MRRDHGRDGKVVAGKVLATRAGGQSGRSSVATHLIGKEPLV